MGFSTQENWSGCYALLKCMLSSGKRYSLVKMPKILGELLTKLKHMEVRKQQLDLDMEQWTGSKLGKEYDKAVYCHPAYLTSMQSTLCEMLGWMIISWNQDCQKKYQQPQIHI